MGGKKEEASQWKNHWLSFYKGSHTFGLRPHQSEAYGGSAAQFKAMFVHDEPLGPGVLMGLISGALLYSVLCCAVLCRAVLCAVLCAVLSVENIETKLLPPSSFLPALTAATGSPTPTCRLVVREGPETPGKPDGYVNRLLEMSLNRLIRGFKRYGTGTVCMAPCY